MELRSFPRADERPHASQDEPEDQSLWSVHAREQRVDHGLGLALALRKLRVGGQCVTVEPDVIREGAKNVGRVLGPAGHTDVDLADGAEPVAREKRGESALQARGERPAPVRGTEVRGCAFEERGA